MKYLSKTQVVAVSVLLTALITGSVMAYTMHRGTIARLVRSSAGVTRDFQGLEEQWVPASLGDEVGLGEAVRTGAAATAVLALDDGAAITLDPNTVVRFLDHAPQREHFRLERGVAAIRAGELGVQMETARGLVELNANSTVRIEHSRHTTRLRVEMGKALFIQPQEAPQRLAPGDELLLAIDKPPRLLKGRAQPQPDERLAAPTLLASAQAMASLQEGALVEESASVTPSSRAVTDLSKPVRGDLRVRAGENATVHDLGLWTDLRLSYEHVCPAGEAVVDVRSVGGRFAPRAKGLQTAVVRFRTGTALYRVRCPQENERNPLRVVASGTIHLVSDGALRRVPVRPPTNEVDLDGRRYTVLYQNRLPVVVARSPTATGPGRMVVRSGSRLRTVEAPNGSVTFASGELGDGVHEIFFESATDRTRSKVTRFTVRFDNAAPMASIDQRGNISADAGGNVHLSGVVPMGSRVSLSGRGLALDAGGRFAASTLPRQTDTALALRVEHPRAGLHYYVRRIASLGGTP